MSGADPQAAGGASPRQHVKRLRAAVEVNNALELYQFERNGRLIWRAFLKCRESGIAVPEAVLAHMTRWAEALGDAEETADVLRALELGGDKKSKRGAKHLKSSESNWRIASQVERLVMDGMPPGEAVALVATANGKSGEVVRNTYYDVFPRTEVPKSPPAATKRTKPKA